MELSPEARKQWEAVVGGDDTVETPDYMDSLSKDAERVKVMRDAREKKHKILEDHFLGRLTDDRPSFRHQAAIEASEQVMDQEDQQWLAGRVAEVASQKSRAASSEKSKRGFLKGLGSTLAEVPQQVFEGGIDILEQYKGAGRALAGGDSDQRQVRFKQGLESAYQGQDPRAEAGDTTAWKAVRGAARMLPTVYTGAKAYGMAGGAGITAQAGTQAFAHLRERLVSEGVSPGVATTLAMIGAGIEGRIESMVPVPGLGKSGIAGAAEKVAGRLATKLSPAAAKAVKTLGRFGGEYAGEMAEEGLQGATEAFASLAGTRNSGNYEGRSLSEVSSEGLEGVKQAAGPMLPYTIIGGGMHIAKAMESKATADGIVKAAEEGRAPTRREWKRWGLPSEEGKSESDRATAVKEYAEQIANLRAAEERQKAQQAEPSQPPPAGHLAAEEYMSGSGGLDAEQDAPDQPQAEAEQPASGGESTFAGESPDVTSIKESVRDDILRPLRGEGPVPQSIFGSVEGYVNEAMEQIKAGRERDVDVSGDLIKSLSEKARNVSPTETAILQIRYRSLNNQIVEATDRIKSAVTPEDRIAANAEAAEINGKLNQLEEVADRTGTLWSHSGHVRKVELRKDYSPAALMRKAIQSKGSALSDEESQAVAESAARIQEKESRIAAAESGEADIDGDIDESIAADVKAVKKQRSGVYRRTKAKKAVDDAWKDFHSKIDKTPGVWDLLKGEGGALNVDLVESAMKVAKAYIDLGAATFSELSAHVKKRFGEQSESAMKLFGEAWTKLQDAGEIPQVELDADDAAGIVRFVKRLQRSLVEADVTERNAVVSAIHGELKAILPEITEREVRDAMSGYGKYRELSKDEIDVAIRDINGQLQQVSKLEDMQSGKPPAKTGQQRREPSDEERRLIQQVNEAKRRGGFDQVDSASHLKSALSSAKTAIRNAMNDMAHEILAREQTVGGKTQITPDAGLIELRRRMAELREIYDDTFGKKAMSEAQRIAATEKAIDKAIEQIESDIESGDVAPKPRKAGPSSPSLDAKRAKLDGLRTVRNEMREALNPKMSKEDRSKLAYQRNLEKRIADYKLRRAQMVGGTYEQAEPKKKDYGKRTISLKYELEQEKVKFREMQDAWEAKRLSKVMKAAKLTAETLNVSRALLTSLDFSAVGRQGGLVVWGHPIMAAKALAPMLKAATSDKGQFEAAENLRNRVNSLLYQQVKLGVTVGEGRLSKQEEAWMGKLLYKLAKIPVLKHILKPVIGSERAYVTFLSVLRADLFDVMAAKLTAGGREMTLDEAKVIANYVNVATGRGSLGQLEPIAVTLATAFFAPKYVASRFQYLTLQPMWKGNARTRGLIAKEYGRTLAGMSTAFAAVMFAMWAASDDDEEVSLSLNPESPDFCKVRCGDQVIDMPAAGMSQVIRFSYKMSRNAYYGAKSLAGVASKSERKEMKKTPQIAWNFTRSKSSPLISNVTDILSGETVVGQKVTPQLVVQNSVTPLALKDIIGSMKSDGMTKDAILASFIIAGANVGTYREKNRDKRSILRISLPKK